jgi:hypothetical protein
MPIVSKFSKRRVNNISPAANAVKAVLRGRYLTIDEMMRILTPMYTFGTLQMAISELLQRRKIRVSHWQLDGTQTGKRKVYAGNKQPRYA